MSDTTGEDVVDLGFARLDTGRLARTGDPEVVYGAGKTVEQVVTLLRTLQSAHPERAVVATRLDEPRRSGCYRSRASDHLR